MNYTKVIPPNNPIYKQGHYKPTNLHKYVGDPNHIIYRSSWELKFMVQCDKNDNVISWSSEPFPIPYYNPFDEKVHQYYVDFWMIVNTSDGPKKYLVEIKPYKKTIAPVYEQIYKKKGSLEKHLQEKKEFIINKCKWDAAKDLAKKSNMEFIIFTEYELKIKKRV